MSHYNQKPEKPTAELLLEIYHSLVGSYGQRHKWFGTTRDEIIVGAVLTQNTNWANVEKSLEELRHAGLLTLPAIAKQSPEQLAALIRPSGYHNQKASRLKTIAQSLLSGDMPEEPLQRRAYLLSLKGIGPETADCILLYADHLPFFVVDAYTLRIFSRLGLVPNNISYHDLQHWFSANLPKDVGLYQEFHALIIQLAKSACLSKPKCCQCLFSTLCPQSEANS